MKPWIFGALGAVLLVPACDQSAGTASAAAPLAAHVAANDKVEAGKYIAIIGGCHDCHTPGFAEALGDVPEETFLTGAPVGFSGPWGTSYPANLRLVAQAYAEEEWVDMLKTRVGLPPMPWQNLHMMAPEDLAALHAYLIALGPLGEAMPTSLAPGQAPATPYIVFAPVMPE